MQEGANIVTHPRQASWRSQVLQGMLWVFTGIGVPAVVYTLATGSRGLTRPATLLAILLTAVSVLVACARRWPFALRAVAFTGVVYTAGVLSLLSIGFTPGAGLLMLLVVVTCGLFFAWRWLWVGLLATTASFAGVGALYATGVIATPRLDLLDFSQGWNIVRVTMAYLVLAGTVVVSVSYVVRRIERSLREAAEALARYEAERDKRTEAEVALQASEETYRQLVENINDVMYATDATGVFTYLSPAAEAQSGYTPAELVGRVFSDFIYEEDRDSILTQFEATLSGHLEPSEYRVVTKSGALRWIRSSSRPIYQSDRVVGLRGVFIDITKQRELEEQLRQTSKMEAMGTLAGGIAHEFNNLLSAILGFTELTQLEVPEGSTTRANLQHVLEAGSRAKDLVQQILLFSRPSDATREPLSFAGVIRDVLTLLRASLPATIDLHLHINEATGTVLAHRTHIHQIVMNLGTNAGYAMRETGGSLTIAVDDVEVNATFAGAHAGLRQGPYVRCSVGDTGVGMPSDIMQHIFDPFFTTKEVGEGTGMGLAIVHGIVTSYSGAITVKSTPGNGTTFAIYLPRIPAAITEDAALLEADIPQGKASILFVDDEEMLAEVGHATLQHLGYDVVSMTSSVKALEAFQTMPQRFDLVITDQTMPTLTGEHLVHELRRIRPDIPIILCTGFSHVMDAEKAHAMGVDAFCMKPLAARELATRIQQVLGKRTA